MTSEAFIAAAQSRAARREEMANARKLKRKELELAKSKRAVERDQRQQERMRKAIEREALKEFNKKWTSKACKEAGERLWTSIREAMANPNTTATYRAPSAACNWNRKIAIARKKAKRAKNNVPHLPEMIPISEAFRFTAAHAGSVSSIEAAVVRRDAEADTPQ